MVSSSCLLSLFRYGVDIDNRGIVVYLTGMSFDWELGRLHPEYIKISISLNPQEWKAEGGGLVD
jgi:hypothetical protein